MGCRGPSFPRDPRRRRAARSIGGSLDANRPDGGHVTQAHATASKCACARICEAWWALPAASWIDTMILVPASTSTWGVRMRAPR